VQNAPDADAAAGAGRASGAGEARDARPPRRRCAPAVPGRGEDRFVNIQAVASNSAQGKAYSSRSQELQQKKNTELAEKTRALQAAQQKLQTQSGVMNDDARALLEKDNRTG